MSFLLAHVHSWSSNGYVYLAYFYRTPRFSETTPFLGTLLWDYRSFDMRTTKKPETFDIPRSALHAFSRLINFMFYKNPTRA